MKTRPWIAVLPLLAAWGTAAAQDPPNPSFYLVNRAGNPINRVYATPAGTSNWGQDRLADAIIPPGRSYPIRLPADGHCVFDIRVVYVNGRSDERRRLNTCTIDNVAFPGGRPVPATNPTRQEDDPSFILINRSRNVLNELYVSLTGDDSWGNDRLGDDTLPGGSTRVIRLPAGECIYDIRVVFANGEANERRRLNLCEITDLRVP